MHARTCTCVPSNLQIVTDSAGDAAAAAVAVAAIAVAEAIGPEAHSGDIGIAPRL